MATAAKKQRVGVIGSGTATQKSIKSTFADFVPAEQKAHDVEFVLPLTKADFNAGVKTVADWLIANDVPFVGVTDDAGTRARTLKPYTNNVSKLVVTETDNIGEKIVSLLNAKGIDKKQLLVFYTEDDDDQLDGAMSGAWKRSIIVRDILDGLGELEEPDEDDEEDDSEADDEEEPEAPSADEEEEDDADSDDEEESEDDDEEDDEPEPAPKPSAKSKPSTKAAAEKPKAESNGSGTVDIDALADLVADKVLTGIAARLQA